MTGIEVRFTNVTCFSLNVSGPKNLNRGDSTNPEFYVSKNYCVYLPTFGPYCSFSVSTSKKFLFINNALF